MRESDIRPDDVFSEYLRLSELDATTMLELGSGFAEVPCPACTCREQRPSFRKSGFSYVECVACGSLFVSPRPGPSLLAQFYESSPSSLYWAEVFWPRVAESRVEKVIRPRVQRVLQSNRIVALGGDFTAVDVGAGAGSFLFELRAAAPGIEAIAVEPGPALAEQARVKGLRVCVSSSEDVRSWGDPADLVTAFEVIEHVYDPCAFVVSLLRFCRPGGTVLVTGLGGDGFDIRMLKSESKAASVPHHLNFLSVRGLELMFSRAGFENISVETPGELDVEIVSKALAAGSGEHVPDFVRVLLSERGDTEKELLQEFLQATRMSSHAWIWATRPPVESDQESETDAEL